MNKLKKKPPRISNISISNVGPLGDLRLTFPVKADHDPMAELHLFVGPNGSGKSTVLRALASAFQARTFLTDVGPVESRLRPEGGSNVFFTFDDVLWYYDSSRMAPCLQEGNPKDYTDALVDYYAGVEQYDQSMSGHGKRFRFAALGYSGRRGLRPGRFSIESPLDLTKEATHNPFQYALSFDDTVRSRSVLTWVAVKLTKIALSRESGDLKFATLVNKSLQRMTDFVQEVTGWDVKFRIEYKHILDVVMSVNGTTVPLDGLSDGLNSIVSLVADLTMRLESIPWENQEIDAFSQPVILFLDDVCVHMCPEWQRGFFPALRNLLPNAQIFAATNTPDVAEYAEWIADKGRTTARIYKLPVSTGVCS